MIAKQLVLLFLSLLLFKFSAAVEQAEKFVGEIDGHHVEAPYYEPGSPDLHPERKQFDAESIQELMEVFKNMTRDMIIEKKYVYQMRGYPGILKGLFNKNNAALERLAKEGKSPVLISKFVKDSMRTFRDVLKSKGDPKISEYIKPLSGEEFIVEVNKVMDLLLKIIIENPKGVNLKWAELSIDDMKLDEYLPPYINYYRSRGYGFFIGTLDAVLMFMEMFFK